MKISEKQLSVIMSHLIPDKSTGPDNIGNLILEIPSPAITLFVNP